MPTAPYSPVVLTDLNLPWERVLHLGVPVTFVPRQVITVSAATASSGFYYIRKGRVRLSYIAPNGQEKVLFYLGKGTLFAEIPIMVISADCIFTCMDEVAAVLFKKKEVTSLQFAKEHPELMLNWIESSCIKSGNFFNQLCNSGLFDAFGNVCRLLYSMALHSPDPRRLVPQLSQQELASMLGIHRGSLHKALTRLKKENVIGDYSKRELRIYDLDLLKYYAEA